MKTYIALLENGDVYTWGNCFNGQLGYHSIGNKQLTPKFVETLQIELRVEARDTQTIFYGKDNRVIRRYGGI